MSVIKVINNLYASFPGNKFIFTSIFNKQQKIRFIIKPTGLNCNNFQKMLHLKLKRDDFSRKCVE